MAHGTESLFSNSYAEARQRFVSSAKAVNAKITTHSINCESTEPLAIDVATIGESNLPTVLVSSGLHGAEGFFGSAIQLALLQQLRQRPSPGIRYALVHALNPFGFSKIRRVNEDNVDLNRNFHDNAANYRGAPEEYSALDSFLNPQTAPVRFDWFRTKAMWLIWRHGLQALKQAVAGGQYDFPRGLFFGGKAACETTRVVFEHSVEWVGDAKKVIHVDLHSGLGPFASCKLLLNEPLDSPMHRWYAEVFGEESVESLATADGTAYRISGFFGAWMQNQFQSRDYRFVGAEFGTYDVIRVLRALRRENQFHHFGKLSDSGYAEAKRELLECFCPEDVSWRRKVVEKGLLVMDQAANALKTNA